MTRFIKYTLILTICTCWDIYTTWLRSPDLSREQNPIVKYLGLNWIGFIIYQFALLIIMLIIVRRAIQTDLTILPTSSRLSITQLFSHIYFGDLRPAWKIFLSFSSSFDRSWYFIAGILIYAIPLIHITAGISNLILYLSPSYVVWFNKSMILNIIIGTAFVIFFSITLFIFREYNAYKKKVG